MKNKETVLYLGQWEEKHNINFKRIEFDTFKNAIKNNKFTLTPQKWIRQTNTIGLITKAGKYDSGTFAHKFSEWISSELKTSLIREFSAFSGDYKILNIEDNTSIFEKIRYIDEYCNEFWYARELMKVLEYNEWRKFNKVIKKL